MTLSPQIAIEGSFCIIYAAETVVSPAIISVYMGDALPCLASPCLARATTKPLICLIWGVQRRVLLRDYFRDEENQQLPSSKEDTQKPTFPQAKNILICCICATMTSLYTWLLGPPNPLMNRSSLFIWCYVLFLFIFFLHHFGTWCTPHIARASGFLK